jgi:hypothetical protein
MGTQDRIPTIIARGFDLIKRVQTENWVGSGSQAEVDQLPNSWPIIHNTSELPAQDSMSELACGC